MSSLQCGKGETPDAAEEAHVETSFDALPDALALKTLLLVPIDARLRTGALLQRRCARLLRQPDAWRVISFAGCIVPVSDRILQLLCARAGAALRCLDLSGCDANRARVTALGVINALQGAAGLHLERLCTRCADDDQRYLCYFDDQRAVTLREACPQLSDGTFMLRLDADVRQSTAAAASYVLPGRVCVTVRYGIWTAHSFTDLLTRLAARERSRGAADCGAVVGLRLFRASFSPNVARALTELMMCAKLQQLSLQIEDVSMSDGHSSVCAVLASAIRRTRIQSLNLDVLHLGNEIAAIADILSDANCSLSSVSLTGRYPSHPAGGRYAALLAAAVATNASLTALYVLDAGLDEKDVSTLAHVCVSHATLRMVCCRGGGICKPLRETLTMLMAVKTPRPLQWSWAFECVIRSPGGVRSA